MTIRPVQKYQPREIYKTIRLDDLKNLFFEEEYSKYKKNVIKEYVYYSAKRQIA